MSAAPFPTTHALLSARALLEQALPAFDIPDPRACRLYSPGVNDTYAVDTVDGGRYFLRVFRWGWRSFDEAAYEVDVLNHLRRKGAAVAYPLPLKAGGPHISSGSHISSDPLYAIGPLYASGFLLPLAAPEGPRWAMLCALAPGAEPDYEQDAPRKAYAYGQAVAGLHNALDDFHSPHPRFQLDLDHLLDAPLRHAEPFLAHDLAAWKEICGLVSELRRRLDGLPAASLTWGYVHGDLQGYHHRLAPDGTHTFFDFDNGGEGIQAYDLAVFRWCARLSDKESEWWPPYLEGYTAARPLSPLDLQAIPLLVGARYTWHFGLHTANAQDWGCEFLNQAYFARVIQNLRQVEKDFY